MTEQLCLLAVHAHPDDESSKGAATVSRYAAAGVHTVLVCCTGGEEGDILNPAMDRPEVRANLPEIRKQELESAARIIGYHDVVELGYRDSGMPGSDANNHPESFAAADLDEAVGRLVAAIRRTRPQVILTYHEDQKGYPHPDHLRVHDITIPAFERAADPEAYPGTGEPWQPLKLYYMGWSRRRVVAFHEQFLALGLESPWAEWIERPAREENLTTIIDVSSHTHVRRQALLAHATQIDPDSRHWFGLPPEVADTVHPFDEYELARSLVDTELPEDDLFAGITSAVRRR